MTKFSVRLLGEDSARIFETASEANVDGIAKQLVSAGYMLGRMKTSERIPEPQEVAVLAAQVKWISVIPGAEGRRV
jgi:hypothetical protein